MGAMLMLVRKGNSISLLRNVSYAGAEVDKREPGQKPDSRSVLIHDMKILHRHPVFLLNAWGYVPIQACLGAFTYWGPKAAMQIFDRPKAIADNTIGALTVCTSIAGAFSTQPGRHFMARQDTGCQSGCSFCE